MAYISIPQYSETQTTSNEVGTPMAKLEILLLVEDNSDDVILVQRTISKVDAGISVVVHSFAETALDYLKAVSKLPQLILLDLGLPGMNGSELITILHSIKRLERIPIVILTGGAADVAQTYSLGVADYILKPMSVEDFRRVLNKLGYDNS